MTRNCFIAALFVVAAVFHHGNCARILGVFPTASISHQVVFRALTLELNKRGHELVVITTDPVHDSTLTNYTEIDISFVYDKNPKYNIISVRGMIGWFELFLLYESILNDITESILGHPELENLYAPNSNKKFDLILLETFFCPVFLPLAKRFDAPIIGMASLGLSVQLQYNIGNPVLSSHPSVWELSTRVSGTLTFWQRLANFVEIMKFIHYYKNSFMPRQRIMASKYFGNDIPSLDELERNISLIFENQHGAISFVKPNVPKIISIGGIHISKKIKPLTKDLQRILDEATQGFVYMSLGSNVKSSMLSDGARAEFIAAFAQLPYLVIWKFEDDELVGKPDNVLVMKWAPQQAILAHPNLRVFVYQGGLQSTEEAISHGVPLVGLPVMGDQDMQISKMVSLGVAKKLDITAINRNDLLEAIRTVALDTSYKERMLNLRSLITDKPQDPLENAIWWTEFVIRHKGAAHLHSSTADEPWYTRQLEIDIIAFLTAGCVIVLNLLLIILYQFLAYVIKKFNNRSFGKKQKLN